jgi:excisionase family DNA binding protein
VAKTNAVAVPVSAPRLLDIKNAAHYLSTSVWQMRQLVWSKQIPNVRLGHKILFDRADLDKFVEAAKA